MADISEQSPSGSDRFRRSDRLRSWEWTSSSQRYPGTNSDMHWWTWGSDDALYFVDDDGQNFGRPWNFAHLLRVTGTPPDHVIEEVTDFPELRRPVDPRYRRYVNGALCVDQTMFVAAYDYADDLPVFAGQFDYVDKVSPHGGVAALMISQDFGATWSNVPDPHWTDDAYFLGPRFAGLAFVGFGPGHTGVPSRYGDYVFAISNDVNWETGDHAFLARVPRDRVQDRAAWEFWAAPGEGAFEVEAVWTSDEWAARPVLRDPGRIGHPTMVYNAALDLFLLSYSTDSVPHTFGTPASVAERSWVRTTELVILEASDPWGPWRLVHHEPMWEHPHTPYLPQIPAKWLAADGMSGWMVFSGDYTVPDCAGEYYGFMTRSFRVGE